MYMFNLNLPFVLCNLKDFFGTTCTEMLVDSFTVIHFRFVQSLNKKEPVRQAVRIPYNMYIVHTCIGFLCDYKIYFCILSRLGEGRGGVPTRHRLRD
jgi:hypothetical protein